MPTEAGSGEPVCQVCGEPLGGRPVVACSRCATLHHRDCWEYNHTCSTYGCHGSTPVAPPAPRPAEEAVVYLGEAEVTGGRRLLQVLLAVALTSVLAAIAVPSLVGPEPAPAVTPSPARPAPPAERPAAATMRNSLGMAFSWIPPGVFQMGSPNDEPGSFDEERPVHQVAIPHGFWMGVHEVTVGDWTRVAREESIGVPTWLTSAAGSGLTTVDPSFAQFGPALTHRRSPMVGISWHDAVRFCHALTDLELRSKSLPAGFAYRMPTESEWEYACRAGATSAPYGGRLTVQGPFRCADLDRAAWYGGNSVYPGGRGADLREAWDLLVSRWGARGNPGLAWAVAAQETCPHTKNGFQPVGLKEPNAWRLHDMLGNVAEWCVDQWREGYVGAPVEGEPVLVGDPTTRVLRGGSWCSPAFRCRPSSRGRGLATSRVFEAGLRVVAAPAEARPRSVRD